MAEQQNDKKGKQDKKAKKEKSGNGNGLVIILLIITLVTVFAASGLIAYYVVFKTPAQKTVIKEVKASENETTVALTEFTINLADEDAARFIKFTPYLAYTDSKVADEITSKTPQIRDAINTFVRSKKSTDFDGAGLVKAKLQLVDKINGILTTGKISNIYLTDILISG